jgi:hypothetical protein
MSRFILLVAATCCLASCGKAQAFSAEDLVATTWSPDRAYCNQLFVRFTNDALEFHPPDRPATRLRVWDIIEPAKPSGTLMIVTSEEGITERPADENLYALLLERSGDRMKLIAQGTPLGLAPVDPASTNAQRFDLVPCSGA